MRHLVLTVLAITVMSGCNNTNNEASPSAQSNHQVHVQQTVPSKREIKNQGQVANRLEQIASSVPHVSGVNCVVIGNTAIVGINVDGDLERARVGTIKYSVAEALRKDPYGAHAIVTADMDIGNRLREIRQDIRNGRPVSGFANELADIIGRIIPQLPQDIIPKDNHPTVDTNNRKHDRKQLNNKSLAR